MKPAVRLLTLALALSSCAQAAPPPDPAAILAPVIASQARIHGGACVRAAIVEDSLADQRRFAAYSAGSKQGSAAAIYHWTVPSSRPGEWATKTELPPAEARALSEAARELIRAPPQPRSIARIGAGTLPRGVKLCADEKQRPFLIFSAPATRSDIAFVDSGYVCEGLCGNGLLYALRRTGSGWRIVSIVFTWIS
jgi:hypothetical protein